MIYIWSIKWYYKMHQCDDDVDVDVESKVKQIVHVGNGSVISSRIYNCVEQVIYMSNE